MPTDFSTVMKRLFSHPAQGRKLQRRSGPPISFQRLAAGCPEDLDYPVRYSPGMALHEAFWADGVRPPGYKRPMGPDARILVPVLGMCGAGKTCLCNNFLEGYWGGPRDSGGGHISPTASQSYFCEGTIYKVTTSEIPPRSGFNDMLKQYDGQDLSVVVLVVYSITSRESFDIACRLVDELRASLARAKLPVSVMLMGLRKDRDSLRQVSRADGETFAMERGILFAETSAMTGRGVRGAFGLIVEAVQSLGSTLPKGVEGSSLVNRMALDSLKQEIFRLGVQCFEETRDRRCPAYESRLDPGIRPSRGLRRPTYHSGWTASPSVQARETVI